MKWLLVSPRHRRRAAIWASIGVVAFLAAALAGSLAVPPGPVFWGGSGFVAFVFCMRRAIALWRVDEMVFDHKPSRPIEHRPPREFRAQAEGSLPQGHSAPPRRLARPLAWAILAAATASSAAGQQTLFNVPSADVLDKGKLYFETDWLWRPNAPSFAAGSPLRAVYGFGSNVEGGINSSGINTPGRSMPTAIAAAKWQPVKVGGFALTAGAHGLFFLRGSTDGDPAGHFYAHASYALPTNTRITAGGWVATAGYAAPADTRGGLFALEQKVNDHLNVNADWFTGKNGLGYFTPGIASAWGSWTVYAGYSLKNGNSKGNGLLLELGFNVP
jgi:hypothetical protein